jgi:sterol desaturase/sphingolipid hydroxylase (fatty acid hydroxylase superfamily)
MPEMLIYIEHNDWLMAVTLFSSLALCLLLEALSPLVAFDDQYKKLRHVGVNTVFLTSTIIVSAPLLTLHGMAFLWLDANQLGLLNLTEAPLWFELLVAVLALDLFAQYGVHFLLHRVKWMWRLHMVHHNDSHVDATTGFRHHPGDAITRSVGSLIAVLLFGIPVTYYLFYRIITLFFAYFTHANFRLPKAVDRALSYVLVTPDMHKFHHHFQRPWTDTNFGNIFSIWDRMFGTLTYDNVENVQYGLDVVEQGRDEDIVYQYILPFDMSIQTDDRPGFFAQ